MSDRTDVNRRRSIRLRDYDYRQAGAYFITICTHRRSSLFGEVHNGLMHLNEYGCVVEQSWSWLGTRHGYVDLDTFVIMPNHLHGVLLIEGGDGGDDGDDAATHSRKPLGRLIGAFKTVAAKQIGRSPSWPGGDVWQRNYYEHIVRNERSLDVIRAYIEQNPARWPEDVLHPNHPRPWPHR